MDALDIFAFVVIGVLITAAVIIVVALGQLPGQIAQRRGHPQAAAINVAGWLGVATLGLLWPLALIWAFLKPFSAVTVGSTTDQGSQSSPGLNPQGQLAQMQARVDSLEAALHSLQSKKDVTP